MSETRQPLTAFMAAAALMPLLPAAGLAQGVPPSADVLASPGQRRQMERFAGDAAERLALDMERMRSGCADRSPPVLPAPETMPVLAARSDPFLGCAPGAPMAVRTVMQELRTVSPGVARGRAELLLIRDGCATVVRVSVAFRVARAADGRASFVAESYEASPRDRPGDRASHRLAPTAPMVRRIIAD